MAERGDFSAATALPASGSTECWTSSGCRLRPSAKCVCAPLGCTRTLRASVLVPLMLFGLPEEIHVLGEGWVLKDEFHVTAAETPWLAERAGVPPRARLAGAGVGA